MSTSRLAALALVSVLLGCSDPEVSAGDLPVLDPDGVRAKLVELRGKPVLVNLWATWCAPCVDEMKALVEAHETVVAGGGEIVGINVDVSNSEIKLAHQTENIAAFVERRKLPFPVWIWNGTDHDGLFDAIGIARQKGIPVTIALDAAGKVVETHVGEADVERFEELFELASGR